MRHLLLAAAVLASSALVGCSSMKPDAKTMATPKKKTAAFCCPITGPCVAQTENERAAR